VRHNGNREVILVPLWGQFERTFQPYVSRRGADPDFEGARFGNPVVSGLAGERQGGLVQRERLRRGYIGLEAEGFEITFRNLKLQVIE